MEQGDPGARGGRRDVGGGRVNSFGNAVNLVCYRHLGYLHHTFQSGEILTFVRLTREPYEVSTASPVSVYSSLE